MPFHPSGDTLVLPPDWTAPSVGELKFDGFNNYRTATLPLTFRGPPGVVNVWGQLWLNDCGKITIHAGQGAVEVRGGQHDYPSFGLLATNGTRPLVVRITGSRPCQDIRLHDLQVRAIPVAAPTHCKQVSGTLAVILLLFGLWHLLKPGSV